MSGLLKALLPISMFAPPRDQKRPYYTHAWVRDITFEVNTLEPIPEYSEEWADTKEDYFSYKVLTNSSIHFDDANTVSLSYQMMNYDDADIQEDLELVNKEIPIDKDSRRVANVLFENGVNSDDMQAILATYGFKSELSNYTEAYNAIYADFVRYFQQYNLQVPSISFYHYDGRHFTFSFDGWTSETPPESLANALEAILGNVLKPIHALPRVTSET